MSFDPTLIGFGALVGLSLGLTGSGGSILAIPLLVYGTGLPIQHALVVSLLMVACIAAFGAVRQTLSKQIDWRAAILFSLTGMVISPLVVSITHNVNETLRLSLFALLMLFVAWRMAYPPQKKVRSSTLKETTPSGAIRISLGGGLAGALAGFFGVGGGFVIVPLLTFLFAMPYAQAVGTSLASIALISSSAIAGHFIKGVSLDFGMLITFISGGVLGLLLGIFTMNKIPELMAKRVFAVITAALAIFMLVDKLFLHQGGAL